MDDAYRDYLASFDRNRSDNQDELVDWLSDNPGYSSSIDSDFWTERFLDCATFFSRCRPIVKPFAVVRLAALYPKMEPFLGVVQGDGFIAQIEAALDYVDPFDWSGNKHCGNNFLFGNCIWELTNYDKTLSSEQIKLVLLESVDAERRKFERLKSKFYGATGENRRPIRERVPESVRIYVWRRDEGKCVRCGSQQRLEYDHIIPVDKGGSSTERNIQLLCEMCNRQKGTSI